MRINTNNFIQADTGSASNAAMMPEMPEQGAAFADRLQKAIQNSGQVKNKATSSSTEDAKLKAACRDMEAVFLNMMMAQMRKTIPQEGMLGNSREEQMLTSMLDTEMTKNMAQAGGMGLADMLYRQLSKTTVTGQAKK